MANFQILNNKKHSALRIDAHKAIIANGQLDSVVVFPTEFAELQKEYPIVFRKNPETGEFASFCLFGLEQGENFFLTEKGWKAFYIPAAIARGPFLVGYQNQNNQSEKEPVISVDVEHISISDEQGEPAFGQDGQVSPYVQQVQNCLMAIHHGRQSERSMFNYFLEYDLIEPMAIEIELNNGRKFKLEGNYTIHRENLARLSGERLEALNKNGYLQAAYSVVGSTSNISKLVELKNLLA